MTQRLLRLPEVKERTGLSRSSIYNFIKAGKFPAPIPLSERAIAWDSEAIDAWIKKQIQAAAVSRPSPKAGE